MADESSRGVQSISLAAAAPLSRGRRRRRAGGPNRQGRRSRGLEDKMSTDTIPGGDAEDGVRKRADASTTAPNRKTIEADERQTERQAPDNAAPGEGAQ